MTSLSTRLRALPLRMATAGTLAAAGCAWSPTPTRRTVHLASSHSPFPSQAAALVQSLPAIDH